MNDKFDEPTTHGDRVSMLVKSLASREVKTQPTLEQTIALIKPIVEEIRLIVGQEVANSINRFADNPVGDLAKKRQVATGISDLLDGLGLRVKCPKTGRPAALMSDVRTDHHPDGYFKTVLSSKPHSASRLRVLPRIEVVPRDMDTKPHRRIGPNSPWQR